MGLLTGFQRWVIAITAALVALRVFFPVHYYAGRGWRTDAFATLLQVLGILVVAAAIFVLAPSPNFRKIRRALLGSAVVVVWLIYLIIAAAVLVTRFSASPTSQIPDLVFGPRQSATAQIPWWPLGLTAAAGLVPLWLTAYFFRPVPTLTYALSSARRLLRWLAHWLGLLFAGVLVAGLLGLIIWGFMRLRGR